MEIAVRIEDPEAEVSVEFGVLDELDCEIQIGDLTISARWKVYETLYNQLRAYFVVDERAGE